MTNIDRRRFLGAAVAGAALCGAVPAADDKKPRLKKAVKYGMIRIDAPIKDKFELIKSLGFLGVEIDSPSGLDLKEANKAQEDTGIKIHGVIDSVHWRDTLSHPDDKVRARGLAALETALKDANTVGADTALLVPGVVNKDATYEQCRDRSQAEVRKVLPLAEKLNVKIAIEVVWNDFITKPEQLIEYVDAFKSPYVGAYFDCSNMVKYGVKSGDWIRKLGKRMLKFDFKGYSKSKKWVPIGEGDEDWPDILEALKEVGYNGWATAEVNGGGRKELQDVAERMNRILGLGG
jgi:L-ribulose-5-phosphate 3-epimerase